MYSGLATQLAKKLQDAGFSATEQGAGILVSLNRSITTLEVVAVVGDWYKVTQVAKNKVMVEEC